MVGNILLFVGLRLELLAKANVRSRLESFECLDTLMSRIDFEVSGQLFIQSFRRINMARHSVCGFRPCDTLRRVSSNCRGKLLD